MMVWGAGKKILVIGDRGQLGSQFFVSGAHADIVRASDYRMDITKLSSCDNVLQRVCPDVVINCSAYTAVDNAENEQSSAFAVNAEGPKFIATWCAANNSHLVHISTDYVFSGAKSLYKGYIETDLTDPTSVYGRSKLMGEEGIRKEENLDYTILRTAWLYGVNGKNFLKTMLRLVIADPKRQLKVVNDQFGTPTSTDALVRQIQSVIDNNVFGVFHASSRGYCSWYEFACEFFACMGIDHQLVPCTTEEFPTQAQRPINSILINEGLCELGFDCFVDWRDDLALFIDSYGDQLIEETKCSLNTN